MLLDHHVLELELGVVPNIKAILRSLSNQSTRIELIRGREEAARATTPTCQHLLLCRLLAVLLLLDRFQVSELLLT